MTFCLIIAIHIFVTLFCTDICRWRVVWRDSQWCLWVTSAMRRQASWLELNCKGLISYFRQAGGVRKDRGSPPGSNLNRNWKQNKWEIAENVEVQIHRNVGQARHQHQWTFWGAPQNGNKKDALTAADWGHGEEEEEMLPHVIWGNEVSNIFFTHC